MTPDLYRRNRRLLALASAGMAALVFLIVQARKPGPELAGRFVNFLVNYAGDPVLVFRSDGSTVRIGASRSIDEAWCSRDLPAGVNRDGTVYGCFGRLTADDGRSYVMALSARYVNRSPALASGIENYDVRPFDEADQRELLSRWQAIRRAPRRWPAGDVRRPRRGGDRRPRRSWHPPACRRRPPRTRSDPA
jgi:hypothetical protein